MLPATRAAGGRAALGLILATVAAEAKLIIEDYAALRNIDGRLSAFDWTLVVFYFIVCFAIAILHTKRSSKSREEFFPH